MPDSSHVTGLATQHLTPLAKAAKAAKLGFTEGLKPRIAFLSIGAALVVFIAWLTIFVLGHAQVWAIAMAATHWALPGWASAPPSMGQASIWVWVVQALSGLLAFLISVAAFGVLVMLTLQIVLELVLMPRIQREVLPSYPTLQPGVKGSLRANLLLLMRLWGALIAGLLLWLIPLVGGIAFFALAAYINARSLVNDALDGIATPMERQAIVRQNGWGLLILGLMMGFLLMIPLVGLMAPSVLGASVCHFCFGALVKLRGQASQRSPSLGRPADPPP